MKRLGKQLYRVVINTLIILQTTIISLAADAESEMKQAVFQETAKKVQMYRDFNLVLIGIVAIMIIVAIAIRIYTDKEIMSRKIMDRRYEGVTEKEEIQEVIETQVEDSRDKILDNTGDTDDEAEAKPVDTKRQKIDLSRKKKVERSKAETDESNTVDSVDITYVPKVKESKTPKIEDKSSKLENKPYIQSDLMDEIDSIQREIAEVKKSSSNDGKKVKDLDREKSEETKAISRDEPTSKDEKTEASVGVDKGISKSTKVKHDKKDKEEVELDPSDVIIEGEQLNLKPSEIDIEYVPKLSADILEAEEAGRSLSIEESDNQEDSLDLLMIDIDEPGNEEEFIGQGSFVYRPDRPRLYPQVVPIGVKPSAGKKQTKRDQRREQRQAGRRAMKQMDEAVKQSKAWSNQVKQSKQADSSVAELERKYSDQDYG